MDTTFKLRDTDNKGILYDIVKQVRYKLYLLKFVNYVRNIIANDTDDLHKRYKDDLNKRTEYINHSIHKQRVVHDILYSISDWGKQNSSSSSETLREFYNHVSNIHSSLTVSTGNTYIENVMLLEKYVNYNISECNMFFEMIGEIIKNM
jgi:hypothetical protein